MLIKPDAENAAAVYAALRKFGAPLEGTGVAGFAKPGEFFRMGYEPIIDERIGLKAFFISAPDLVASKLAAGRPQDIADVAAVRKAAEPGPLR